MPRGGQATMQTMRASDDANEREKGKANDSANREHTSTVGRLTRMTAQRSALLSGRGRTQKHSENLVGWRRA
jgi:hypothetical protein